MKLKIIIGLIILAALVSISQKSSNNETVAESNVSTYSAEAEVEKADAQSQNVIEGLNGQSVNKNDGGIQKEFSDGRSVNEAVGLKLDEPVKSGTYSRTEKKPSTGAEGMSF
jgi:hypothetical protein